MPRSWLASPTTLNSRSTWTAAVTAAQPAQLERIAQRARARRLAEHGGQQLLLVVDPGQVRGREGMAVSGEFQRGDAVDMVYSGRKVQTAVTVVTTA